MDKEMERKLKKMFKMRLIALICFYSTFFGFVFNVIHPMLGFVVALSIFSAYVILSRKYWRCPYCGDHFQLRHSSMDFIRYCPYCGEKLK